MPNASPRLLRDANGYQLDGRELTCGDDLVLHLHDRDEVGYFDLDGGPDAPVLLLRGRGDADVIVRLTDATPVSWPNAARRVA